MSRPWFAAVLLAALASAQEQPLAAIARIEGRVLDLRHEPVAAAKVWIATAEDPDTVLASGTCDGDGHFVLQCVLGPGHRLVRATAPGRCIGEQVVRADRPTTVFVHDAATVRGVLRTAAGTPVAGATVVARTPPHSPNFTAREMALTGADGSFALPKVPLGPVSLAALVPGDGLAWQQLMVREDLDVVLATTVPAATSIELVVRGLRTAAIYLCPLAMSPLPLAPSRTRLDAEGKCRLEDLPDWEYELSLHAPGYVLDPITARLKTGKREHRVEFTAQLRGSAMLAWPGTLRDPDGRPLGGVRIAVVPYAYADEFTAVTGADGAFRCECHIAEGRIVSVSCRDPAWAMGRSCAFEPEKPLVLTAVPACQVTGRLLLADGSPAAFVGAELGAANGPPGRSIAVSTDRDGRLLLSGMLPSEHAMQLVVVSRAGSATSKSFDLDKPGTKVDLGDVKLDKPIVIEGVARGADGRVLPGAVVRLHAGDPTRNWELDSRWELATHTDRLGRYRFLGPAPGKGWLQLIVTDEDQFAAPHGVELFDASPGQVQAIDLTATQK